MSTNNQRTDNEAAAFNDALNRLAADAEQEYHNWLASQTEDSYVVDEEPTASWEDWAERECEQLDAESAQCDSRQ